MMEKPPENELVRDYAMILPFHLNPNGGVSTAADFVFCSSQPMLEHPASWPGL